MADKMIGELPPAPQVMDNSLLAVEQGGVAMKMTGAQFKEFAKSGVKDYIDEAQKIVDDAQKLVDQAADSADDAAQSAQEAKEYSGNPPTIKNDTWWIWNAKTQKYVDTGLSSKGNVMYATFYLDTDTGELWMLHDDAYTGPEFSLTEDSGLLIVQIS